VPKKGALSNSVVELRIESLGRPRFGGNVSKNVVSGPTLTLILGVSALRVVAGHFFVDFRVRRILIFILLKNSFVSGILN